VVFFGASLTWGANATDPQLTSFRGQFARRLENAYPLARFKFWDAAIGGTGSQLGVFRFERDVLARKPDLVLLDFSANDDIYSDDAETLASYESLVRRIILDARAPVVQVVFPFLWNVTAGKLDGMKRRDAHHAISQAYHTAIGDAIALAIERVADGRTTPEKLWPVDGVHPGDAGYELFTDAAWAAFQQAVADGLVSQAPAKMLHGDTYMTNRRVRISGLAPLPAGWRIGAPHVVSAYFDMLMSRWLDDEVIAGDASAAAGAKPKDSAPERLKVNFRGSMVMLLGESTPKSGKYRAYVDGKLVEHREGGADKPPLKEFDAGHLGRLLAGNTHYVQTIAIDLDPAQSHTLEIEPAFEAADHELRLESICVAGGAATVAAAE
jgi:lysophospholipase L1-like esterase